MDEPSQPPQSDVETATADPDLLNESVFASFERLLTAPQIAELYAMCLDDADRRIRLLQQTAADQDTEAYRRATHSIKGTCGMVGADRLAAMAAAMEKTSMPAVGDSAPYQQFLAASAELRRILNAKSIPLSSRSGPDTL